MSTSGIAYEFESPSKNKKSLDHSKVQIGTRQIQQKNDEEDNYVTSGLQSNDDVEGLSFDR